MYHLNGRLYQKCLVWMHALKKIFLTHDQANADYIGLYPCAGMYSMDSVTVEERDEFYN